MGRQTSIHRLPESVREALNGWLRDPAITQKEATRRTNLLLAELDLDHPPVSSSAVNRYDLGMRVTGQRLQESREVAEVWVAKLGSRPGGQLGHLVVEMLRTLAFEATQKLSAGEFDAESLPAVIDQVNKLALAAQRLEKSSAENERRERQIRSEERRQAATEAAKVVERNAGKKGISAETVKMIKREILGIAA